MAPSSRPVLRDWTTGKVLGQEAKRLPSVSLFHPLVEDQRPQIQRTGTWAQAQGFALEVMARHWDLALCRRKSSYPQGRAHRWGRHINTVNYKCLSKTPCQFWSEFGVHSSTLIYCGPLGMWVSGTYQISISLVWQGLAGLITTLGITRWYNATSCGCRPMVVSLWNLFWDLRPIMKPNTGQTPKVLIPTLACDRNSELAPVPG
jgi:hypothetical protein